MGDDNGVLSYQAEAAECDSIYANMVKTIKRQRDYAVGVDLEQLNRAYEEAKRLHGNTRRKSGQLYLRHPLAVAEELSRLRCKTSILVAALLHDTMEDCDMTYERLREQFSYEVAEIVDAVTAIKRREKEHDPHFASMTRIGQHDLLDELTNAKLISTEFQREAFLVRFADRNHNLSTLDAMPDGKRLMKIAATREFLIPAAQKLGMRYFDIMLNENCMKYDCEDYQQNTHAQLLNKRNALVHVSRTAYSRMDKVLRDALERTQVFSLPKYNPFTRMRGGDEKMEVAFRRILMPYELHRQMRSDAAFERGQLDLGEIILVCRNIPARDILREFSRFFREHLQKKGVYLEYVGREENAVVVRLTDRYENNFRIVLVPDAELELYFIGDPAGERLTMIDEEAPGDALRSHMTVYAYSPKKGVRKFTNVPVGATALDFAFIVSRSLAVTVKSARIHQSVKDKYQPFAQFDYAYPLRTVLNAEDIVYFDADYFPAGSAEGKNISHVTLDWFAYINTDYAKKCLIHYFKDNGTM